MIVLLKQGRVVSQLTGSQPLEAILSWFRKQA